MKKATLSLTILLLLCGALMSSPNTVFLTDPIQLLSKVSSHFGKMKDAEGDFRLETRLYLFGCSGTTVYEGHAYYRYADSILVKVNDKRAYLAQGNYIRKTDAEGKITYYKILYAPDFGIGYRPEAIPHNFILKTVAENSLEVAVEGQPKPGVLKNVKKVVFYIDPSQNLLTKMDIFFTNENISGNAVIHYQKVDGLVVPVATEGRSAFALRSGALVGFGFKLTSSNIKVNSGVPASYFK